jgi:hypothetical protein
MKAWPVLPRCDSAGLHGGITLLIRNKASTAAEIRVRLGWLAKDIVLG